MTGWIRIWITILVLIQIGHITVILTRLGDDFKASKVIDLRSTLCLFPSIIIISWHLYNICTILPRLRLRCFLNSFDDCSWAAPTILRFWLVCSDTGRVCRGVEQLPWFVLVLHQWVDFASKIETEATIPG